MPDTRDLVDAARSHIVGIVGGGIAGLIVAWECAKVGMTVTLWEAADVGGMTRLDTVGDTTVDVAADALNRNAAVDEVLDAFGMSGELVPAATTARWLLQKTPLALPESPALGVPANPFASEVTSIIGWGGVWRAYLDRLKPVLTIGNAENLGELVRERMGAKVRDRLVAPHTRAELRLDPDGVVIDVALPELNGALTRAGSLSGGVGLLEQPAPPLGLSGGVGRIAAALRARIGELGGTVYDHARVTSARQTGDEWTLQIATADAEPGEPAQREATQGDAAHSEATVQHLVIATDERGARELLAAHVVALPAETATEQTVVTLAVGGVPAQSIRGAGLYAAEGDAAVARIDHVTAQWPNMPRGSGQEIFRVTIPGHTMADDRAIEASISAIAAAYAADARVLDARVERFLRAQDRAASGHADRVATIRASIAKLPQLDVVGAWVAGDGVAEVVADAIQTAETIRRRALFAG